MGEGGFGCTNWLVGIGLGNGLWLVRVIGLGFGFNCGLVIMGFMGFSRVSAIVGCGLCVGGVRFWFWGCCPLGLVMVGYCWLDLVGVSFWLGLFWVRFGFCGLGH